MKRPIYLVLLFVVLSFCARNHEEQKSDSIIESDGSHDEDSQNSDEGFLAYEVQKDTDSGIVRFDIRRIYYGGDSVTLFNLDNSVYAKLVNKNLIVGDKAFDLKETRKDTIALYLNARLTNLEYNLFIVNCIGRLNNKYQIEVQERILLVDTRSAVTEFETFEEHGDLRYP